MLEQNVARISAMTREFLEFARGRTPQVALVDPNSIVEQVAELFRDTARLSGIEISVDAAPAVAPAALDEAAIHTCLTNLVSNALDACETSDQPRGCVTISTHDQAGVLVIEVADDGTGMDYEVKQKVFTNFFTTKAMNKGTGLGLLTTRKIVQEHGGRVSFESIQGKGSRFRLEFPRDRLPALSGQAAGEASGKEASQPG
jgi:signal transduction histidine kinase